MFWLSNHHLNNSISNPFCSLSIFLRLLIHNNSKWLTNRKKLNHSWCVWRRSIQSLSSPTIWIRFGGFLIMSFIFWRMSAKALSDGHTRPQGFWGKKYDICSTIIQTADSNLIQNGYKRICYFISWQRRINLALEMKKLIQRFYSTSEHGEIPWQSRCCNPCLLI